MSYEGYVEAVCKNGHRYKYGCWDREPCPHCKALPAFTNAVDETNGLGQGSISAKGWEFLLMFPEKTETCNLGHLHVTQEAVYRIPYKHEMDQFREYPKDD